MRKALVLFTTALTNRQQAELFQAYAALDSRLGIAIELLEFEDLLPELDREASEIESILQAISPYTKMTDEHDWHGAFVSIRGTSIIPGTYWPHNKIEEFFEDAVIDGILCYLKAKFYYQMFYNAAKFYGSGDNYRQEVTVALNDLYAYGELKAEAGCHTLFRAGKKNGGLY